MNSIKDQVAVITGAAGGIGQALAIEMARRGAACIALVDFSGQVVQVAREINAEVGRVVTIAYRGDTTDPDFRQEVYADFTSKAGLEGAAATLMAEAMYYGSVAVGFIRASPIPRCTGNWGGIHPD